MPPKGTPHAKIVPINGYSDGDASHRPAQPPYAPCDPVLYLEKLARMWMKEKDMFSQGTTYILNQLPADYKLFEKPRANGHRDKYLFGHPNHQIFDSPNKFYPHFRYLMEHDKLGHCACEACKTSAAPIPQVAAVTHAAKGKGKAKEADKGPVDEEGTPDVYAKSMQELYRIGKIDVNIEEPKSMDWRVEQMILPELIETIRRQFSFIPRVGELVLWCRDMDGELAFDPQTNEFKMYNPNKQVFLGHPQWMCGTVTQDPKEEVLIDDLLIETKKENAINISGFRVECLPDPNDPTKGLSKQYSYIPLRNIRPFNFWQEYLQGISEDDWHASIFHGLSVLASICVIKPFRFKGTWPNCAVFCNGAFIGAELLFVGDTVRLISEQSQPQVTDVLHIEKILVKWANLEVDEDGIVDESRAAHVSLRFIGHSYTSDKKRSYKGMTLKSQERMGEYPSGMEGYDRWYYMLRPDLLHDYSHDRIFGRCFEGEAMMLWSAEDEPTLTFGLQGTRAARLYSAENDQRIITAGKKWFWGEHRAECLDLGTFNGIEVGSRDPDRDPKAWRDTLRVIDGETSQKEAPAKMSKAAGRSTFTPINSQSSLVGSALQQADDSDESDNQDSRKAGQENEPSDSDEEMNSEEAVSKEPSLA